MKNLKHLDILEQKLILEANTNLEIDRYFVELGE